MVGDAHAVLFSLPIFAFTILRNNTNLFCIFHVFTSILCFCFRLSRPFFSFQLSHEMTFDEKFDHFATKVCLVDIVDYFSLDMIP